jgi:hypothetical protein
MLLDEIREATKKRVEEANKKEQKQQKRRDERDGTPPNGAPAHLVRQPSTPANAPAVDPGTREDFPEALAVLLDRLDADLNVFRMECLHDSSDLDLLIRD